MNLRGMKHFGISKNIYNVRTFCNFVVPIWIQFVPTALTFKKTLHFAHTVYIYMPQLKRLHAGFSHRGRPGSLPGDFSQDSWRTTYHCSSFPHSFVRFPQLITFLDSSILTYHRAHRCEKVLTMQHRITTSVFKLGNFVLNPVVSLLQSKNLI